MKSLQGAFLLFIIILSISQAENSNNNNEKVKGKQRTRRRALKGGGKKSGSSSDFDDDGIGGELLSVTLKITNLSYQQAFSPMFIMVHNEDTLPLFTLGEGASVPLSILAENGDPEVLAEAYAEQEGVFYAGTYDEGAPWNGGSVIYVRLPYTRRYPFLTFASMAMNTNDGFIAVNGARIFPGLTITGPCYDAGTEVNNENCTSIPGPACASVTGNLRSFFGEGFVHVHRGFYGIGQELADFVYDWRNPMMRVEMMETQ